MELTTLFALTAGTVFAVMVGLWLLSLRLEDASIADIAWGPLFVVVAALAYVGGEGWTGRRILVLAMVSLWGLRLGWHIYRRSRGSDEDPRYARWRREHGAAWRWRSLFQVFLLQGAVLWIVSLPIQLAMGVPGPDTFVVWDAVGELVWAIGFLYEAIADSQLAAFRADPQRDGILDTGLWRTSRHPNYFGEAVLWWGIWIVALSVPWGWAAVISPVVMTWLLRYVSGVPLAEEMMAGRDGWDAYVQRTRIFVPGPTGR